MRNTFHCLCLAVLSLLACACIPSLDNQPLPQGENLLTASIASEPATRTTLSPEQDGISKVLWSEGDVFGVFVDGLPELNIYRLIAGAGSKQATFAGSGRGGSYIAVYPSDIVKSLSGETVSVELPAVQNYSERSFANGTFPMVAVSSTADLSFRNLCSVLKLSMTGHHEVNRLVFRSNDPAVKVSGPATVSLSNLAAPALTVSKGGCDSLVLETGSLQLNDDEATDFYLVLPAQTYKGGFMVRIYTSTGYMDKSLNADFTMVRAQKHDAKTFAVKLDEGFEPSAGLAGSGTENDPFRIGTTGDLLLMRSCVNSGAMMKSLGGSDAPARSACYVLTDDIDLSPLCGEKTGESWTPIADLGVDYDNQEMAFTGVFDGDGHRVYNLYINLNLGYRGFFGYVKGGKIRNLIVEGILKDAGYDSGMIVGSGYGTLENCMAVGRVSGYSDLGGLAGSWYGEIDYCTNRAEVKGTDWTGGIVGSADCVYNCVNEGSVTSSGLCGGIIGFQNVGETVNCRNFGNVTGEKYVGGLIGYARQRSKHYNCINLGAVSGIGHVGGICGFLSSSYASEVNYTTMTNCVNVGAVSLTGTGTAGALVGFNGYDTQFQPDGQNTDYVKVNQCYWLYDPGNGLGMEKAIGDGTGHQENNAALTDAQLKRTSTSGSALYVADDGSAYYDVLDALNACAYDLKSASGSPISAWDYISGNPYPQPGDLPASKPGAGNTVFSLSDASFDFMTKGGSFSVVVTSSLDYSVGGLSDWITQHPFETQSSKPHSHRHSFTVAENKTGVERKCTISFTNSEGKVLSVQVVQKAPYLTVASTEILFTDAAGTKRVAISSSIDWRVTPDAGSNWFTISPAKGTGDGSVAVKVSDNLQSAARSGFLTIASQDGKYSHTVMVIQSGKSGAESEEWKELPFYHQSLAMRFTATWCGWCPYMNRSIGRAQELYPGKIQHLALHGADSELEFSPTQVVQNQYFVSGFPTGIMDGRIEVNNSTDIDAVAALFIAASKETEALYGTASGMAIRSSASGRFVSVDVDAYIKRGGDYKITVLLLEDGIIHAQSGGSSNYVHDNVARVAVTPILGEAFTADALSKRSFNYTVAVPDECKIENMRVLAYIHKKYEGEKKQSGDYGDFYIDNCATIAVGENLPLALVGGGGSGGGGNGQGNEGITPGGEIK